MENTEATSTQGKRSPRPRCPSCGQVLSNRMFDRCLWCGAVLPEELHISDEEKANMLEGQKIKLAAKEAERARLRDEV